MTEFWKDEVSAELTNIDFIEENFSVYWNERYDGKLGMLPTPIGELKEWLNDNAPNWRIAISGHDRFISAISMKFETTDQAALFKLRWL